MLDSRSNERSHVRIMFVRLIVAVFTFAMLVVGCVDDLDPQTGSETHWDPICSLDMGCTAPLECICGNCFLPCEAQAQCADQAPATACSSTEVLIDNCLFLQDGVAGACFPPCTVESDCANFGTDMLCIDSVCIRPQ